LTLTLTIFAIAYFLVAVAASIWGVHFMKTRKTGEWERDRIGSLLFSLYFGLTWPAIFLDGFYD